MLRLVGRAVGGFCVTLITVGCAFMPAFRSPPGGQPSAQQTYPLEVEYELLGTATASACGDAFGGSPDPQAIGGVLYDRAKYLAIQRTDGADGMVAIRAQLTMEGEQKCVVVTGRAYRLLSMRATAGHSAGERSTAPPRKAEEEDAPREEKPAPKPSAEGKLTAKPKKAAVPEKGPLTTPDF